MVVRFSLRLKEDWLRAAYGQEENRLSWLKSRGEIFKDTMYRSMVRQTYAPHKLFLLMDEGDADFFETSFKGLSDIVEPVFSQRWNHYEQVARKIHSYGKTNVAVSRGDSDDLVADNYFERVNGAIHSSVEKGIEFNYIVATRGFVSDGTQIQEIYYSCSPFLTLFRKRWDGANIYAINHEDVRSHPHVAVSDAAWLQYVHGTNIANRLFQSNAGRDEFDAAIAKGAKKTSMKRRSAYRNWPESIHRFKYLKDDSF
ncbi:MAG: glycosyltransferase [Pseudooceanicola nanhaiensis]|uniref:glycosyltransferase n=1 Tax=Pseudooceanicola nanhaiensis TaxID=375761 RepID=UPI004059063E